MKKRTKWIIFLLVIIVIAAAVWLAMPFLKPAQQAVGSYTVGRGDVEATITGSGMLETDDTIDIILPEGIEIDTIFVEKGDIVAEGDVIASLDAASLQYRAAELSSELSALDEQLGARKLKSSITTPVKGRIKYLPVSEDDDVIEAVNTYGALAILSTDGMMQVELKTSSILALNAEVTVKWNGGSGEGKVASRIEGGYLVTVDDEDAPYLGRADIYYDATLVGSGTLNIHAPLAIFGNGGTIEEIHYKLDAELSAGATLFSLGNEPATDTYRQTLADRNEKAEQLQIVLMYENRPNVLANASGIVNEILVTEGKETTGTDGSGEMTAFVLGTGGATKMTIEVDELDINAVAVGQEAVITLDAFASESFSAAVTRISHIGESSGSITTYATDLKLTSDPRLMVGMNGSAVILANRAENVLIIPLGAIHEDENGSYVYVLGTGDAQQKAYIQTGLSDGTYAEVTYGLQEGARIAYSSPKHSFITPFGMTVDADMMKMGPTGGMMHD